MRISWKVLFVALSLLSCKKESSINDTIVGEWRWVQADCVSHGTPIFSRPSDPNREEIDFTFYSDLTYKRENPGFYQPVPYEGNYTLKAKGVDGIDSLVLEGNLNGDYLRGVFGIRIEGEKLFIIDSLNDNRCDNHFERFR